VNASVDMNGKMASFVVAVAIVTSFVFLVPVIHTTIPPPTTNQNCRCAPYIAQSVYGSITYRAFGYGGVIPADRGNWRYYSIYTG
jgi:hypothetical protein